MPRSNRPRRAGRVIRPSVDDGATGDEPRGVLGSTVEDHLGVDHVVRRISGQAATKTYRCPGCDQEVLPGTPHVVAWPLQAPDGGPDRRHWHTPCWAARARRTPRR